MKRWFAFLVLMVCTVVFVIASNESCMRIVTQWMYSGTGLLSSDRYRYGDLYGMTYLEQFKLPKDEQKLPLHKTDTLLRDVELSVIGDSYTYSFLQEHPLTFQRTARYHFVQFEEHNALPLPSNSNRKKIVLIEVVERNAWNTLEVNVLKKCVATNPHEEPSKVFVEKPIESNLDFLFFDHAVFTSIKQVKADMNFQLFGKVSDGAVVSKDGQFLYLKETVSGNSTSNSFHSISKEEYATLELRLNQINDYFTSKGFDEVWLVVAPNPARILQTEGKTPNRLFDFLTNSKSLKLKFINLVPILTKQAAQHFFRSDSHWNQQGAALYREVINQELIHLK